MGARLESYGGSPKLGDTFLGVPIIRIIACLVLSKWPGPTSRDTSVLKT